MFVNTQFLFKHAKVIYVHVCAQRRIRVMRFAFYRQLVRKQYPPPLPPWATSSGNGEGPVSSLNAANVCLRLGTRAQRHTHTHTVLTHTTLRSLPLSPLCHIPSLLHPSPSSPRSPARPPLVASSLSSCFILHNALHPGS